MAENEADWDRAELVFGCTFSPTESGHGSFPENLLETLTAVTAGGGGFFYLYFSYFFGFWVVLFPNHIAKILAQKSWG